MKASKKQKRDTKWVFLKQGTCSRTLLYILNREFDHPMIEEERAIDPMAGGIMQQGYQCGQLWGATMAVGAEAYRRSNGNGKGIGLAMKATETIVDSFQARAGTVDCYDITETNMKSKKEMARYMLSGKFLFCYKLANRWAPEAIKAAQEGLAVNPEELPDEAISCASEVVRMLGGTVQDQHMVAGYAGGVGLSGNGCGALAAAIWMKSLDHNRNNEKKVDYNNNPMADETLKAFFEATEYEFECHRICGRKFESIEDHTEFMKKGGCSKVLNALAGMAVTEPQTEDQQRKEEI